MAQHGTMIQYITLWGLVVFFVPTFATIPSIEINSSYLENRQAIGSTVLFSIVSTQSLTFTNINWNFDTTLVAQITNNARGDLTKTVLSTKYKSRISVNANRNEASEDTKKVVNSSLTFGPLESSDSGISVYVVEDTSRSPSFVLNVSNCSYPTTQQTSSTDCDFGCTANLTCPYNSESVTAVCQANATWSEQLECTQETTTIEPTARIISSTAGESAVGTESAASNDVSSTTSNNSTGGNKGNPKSNGGLSDGAIAGIVIAVVVVVGAGVAGIVFYFKKSGYIPGSTK